MSLTTKRLMIIVSLVANILDIIITVGANVTPVLVDNNKQSNKERIFLFSFHQPYPIFDSFGKKSPLFIYVCVCVFYLLIILFIII